MVKHFTHKNVYNTYTLSPDGVYIDYCLKARHSTVSVYPVNMELVNREDTETLVGTLDVTLHVKVVVAGSWSELSVTILIA